MATNSTEFSHLIKLNTPDEVAWAEEVVRKNLELSNAGEEDNEEYIDCGLEMQHKGLLVWSDGDGNFEHAINLVKEYLERFSPQGYAIMECANTCTRYIPGEVGGTKVYVSVTDEMWGWQLMREFALRRNREEGGTLVEVSLI